MILLSAVLVLAIAEGTKGSIAGLLNKPPLLALGRWSYSIYMSHAFFIYVAALAVGRYSHRPTVNVAGSNVPQLSFAETVVIDLGLVGITLLFSAACYRWFENPVRLWSRRFVAAQLPDTRATGEVATVC